MDNIISKNLTNIQQRIQQACKRANRDPDEVRLLLATKTVQVEKIRFALNQGVNLMGENKVQELSEKYHNLSGLNPEIHFIGHLQTNKAKDVIKYATCIQSLDRYKLAKKLHNRLTAENKQIDAFIQVNTSYEESKFGASPENALELVKRVAQLNTIKIKGLMTIGIFSAKPEKIRKCFSLLKNLQQRISILDLPNVSMNELSMGMSGDLEIAIEEGATIVRVGTAVFGERLYPDSYYWDESR